MPVPDSSDLTPEQHRAAAALLREAAAPLAPLGRLFARRNHELALVGGSVRDVFLRRGHSDLDLTTDARPEQVLEIVADWADTVWEVGISFGTIGLRKGERTIEITTYRSEKYLPHSRKPGVEYGTSLEADLSRRDFTVNAMAARLPSLDLVDPFGGLRDLGHKVLRTPGRPQDSFTDDPLRMLRAARLSAQLGFTVAPEARGAMSELAPRLAVVSAERIPARSSSSCWHPALMARRAALPCWWTPGWPIRSCRRFPGSGWRWTSTSGTRTSTSTR